MPTFLIAGGTGNVGGACVRALSAAGANVKVLSRDPSSKKAQAIACLEGVTLVQGDYCEPSTLTSAFDGVEAAFLGCSNFEGQVAAEKNLIDAAANSSSCAYLVKLGTCGTEGYTAKDSVIQYGRYHAEIEEYLSQASGLKWTVLRPNDFMQNHMGDIFGTLPMGIIAYPVDASSRATIVDTRDVGELAAKLLLSASYDRHDKQKYDVCGPDPICTERLASMYTAALGRPVAAVSPPASEWIAGAEKAGFPTWLATAVSLNFVQFWNLGKLDYPSSPEVLEVCAPRRTMEMWVAEHAPLSPPPKAAESS